MSSELIKLEEVISFSLFGQDEFGVDFRYHGPENNLAFLRTTFYLFLHW